MAGLSKATNGKSGMSSGGAILTAQLSSEAVLHARTHVVQKVPVRAILHLFFLHNFS